MRQNYSGAAVYFKRAADKGDRDGLTNLAVCYDNGWVEGHPPDKVWTIKKTYVVGFQNPPCIKCWIVLLMRSAFQTSKISETFDAKKFPNFQGNFPEIQKTVKFSKWEPLNGNSEKKGTWNGNFRNVGCTPQFCTRFWKFRKMMSYSILEKFPKIQTGTFSRLESHTSHHLPLRCGKNTLCRVKQLNLTLEKGFCLISL